MEQTPFWKTKKLDEMSPEEWESLCDGCARCCLIKFRDEESDEVLHTNVACKLLDIYRCQCTAYPDRHRLVPTCVVLTTELIGQLDWLPHTCAYRLIAEGKDPPAWHPLVAGNTRAIHRAGVSLRAKAISEADIDPEDLEDYILD
ncbi:MAG TPA: YcgN family cysteine cluster protein [Anaerolineaceae bacterium]|nr:YcgN family cysteine cluster protein [Anaerolineaceae bacterium]